MTLFPNLIENDFLKIVEFFFKILFFINKEFDKNQKKQKDNNDFIRLSDFSLLKKTIF